MEYDLFKTGDIRFNNLGSFPDEYTLIEEGAMPEAIFDVGQAFDGYNYVKVPSTILELTNSADAAIVYLRAYIESISNDNNYLLSSDAVIP